MFYLSIIPYRLIGCILFMSESSNGYVMMYGCEAVRAGERKCPFQQGKVGVLQQESASASIWFHPVRACSVI